MNKKAVMDSYQKQMQLESTLAGFERPEMTTMDILSSIKMLKENYKDDDKVLADLQTIAKAESDMLVKSIQSLNSSPLLQQKLGHSFQSAMQLSSLLRQQQARNITSAALNKMLDDSDLSNTLGAKNIALVGGKPLIGPDSSSA